MDGCLLKKLITTKIWESFDCYTPIFSFIASHKTPVWLIVMLHLGIIIFAFWSLRWAVLGFCCHITGQTEADSCHPSHHWWSILTIPVTVIGGEDFRRRRDHRSSLNHPHHHICPVGWRRRGNKRGRCVVKRDMLDGVVSEGLWFCVVPPIYKNRHILGLKGIFPLT